MAARAYTLSEPVSLLAWSSPVGVLHAPCMCVTTTTVIAVYGGLVVLAVFPLPGACKRLYGASLERTMCR